MGFPVEIRLKKTFCVDGRYDDKTGKAIKKKAKVLGF